MKEIDWIGTSLGKVNYLKWWRVDQAVLQTYLPLISMVIWEVISAPLLMMPRMGDRWKLVFLRPGPDPIKIISA